MRFEDWPQRLDAALAASRSRRFAYGTFDCMLFAADCVQAITGVDHAADFRGYDSKVAAYRIIARYGSLEAMITSLLGRDPIHPAQARRGDVVLANIELAPGESGECVGICDKVNCWFPRDPAAIGIRSFPRYAARLAWRIE